MWEGGIEPPSMGLFHKPGRKPPNNLWTQPCEQNNLWRESAQILVASPLPTATVFAPSADTSNMAADLALLQNTALNNSGPTVRLCVTPLALLYSSPKRNPAGIFPFLLSILSPFYSPPSWVSLLSLQNLPLCPLRPLCSVHFAAASSHLGPLFLILLF